MATRSRAAATRTEVVAIVIGAVLLGGSWIIAASRTVPAWEAALFRRINDLSGALWGFLRIPMQLGSLAGSFVVIALTALFTRNRRLALAALLGSQAAYWSAHVVKSIVGRDRPALLLHGVHVHETAGSLGYVSAHTAVAVALAAAIAPSLPRTAQMIAIVLAALVGFARIYAGAHFPLDVVGGAGLGLLCGTLARVAFRVE